MPRYLYHLAEIFLGLETPFNIKIYNESQPFIHESQAAAQVSVIFTPVDSLPPMPPQGIWNEERFYTSLDGAPAAFICNLPNEPPYAVVLGDCNDIRVRYLPQFQRYLSDSAGILNLIGIENILLNHSAFLLHASLIEWQGRGILFSAPSGTGKSTQANLWETYMGSRTINGDRAGVRLSDGGWRAFGMPFAGTSGIYQRESVPISAIVTLAQGPENIIQRLRPSQALARLLPECSCRRWDDRFMQRIFTLLTDFIQQVPVYHLSCRPDQAAVELLRDTILKEALL